jgi:hypothetical protein
MVYVGALPALKDNDIQPEDFAEFYNKFCEII